MSAVDVLGAMTRAKELHDAMGHLEAGAAMVEARAAVAQMIAAAEALSPKYSDMTTVRGRQLMTRKLRTLEAALLGVGGAQ